MSGDDRWTRVGSFLNAESTRRNPVDAVCDGCRRLLHADSCSVMVHSRSGLVAMSGSDVMAARADEIQVVGGEGPTVLASESDLPVVIADVGHGDERWADALRSLGALGIGAVMALPLRQGRARLGVLSCYWSSSTTIASELYADAVVYSDIVTEILLQQLAAANVDVASAVGAASLASPIVQQAVGMLAERHGINVVEAQVRLRASAYADGLRIVDVARRVVNRQEDAS